VVEAGVDVVVAVVDAVVPVPDVAVVAVEDGVNVNETWNCTGNGQPPLAPLDELEPDVLDAALESLEELRLTSETPVTRCSCTMVWATTD
jgi:hypothetical protein